MRPAGCLPCCGPNVPVVTCDCALYLPIAPGSPYADYATANNVISNALEVSCFAYFYRSFGNVTATSTTVGPNYLLMGETFGSNSEAGMYSSLSLNAGTLSCDFVGTKVGGALGDTPSVSLVLYDCQGNTIDSDVLADTASGTLSVTVPSSNTYIALVFWGACVGVPCGWTAANANVYAADLVPNPVIALWDDSGTTRQLEACPKMLLPPLTESTGTWYADETAAQDAIDDQTSNCVGYIEEDHSGMFGAFTATDGGTSLELDGTGDGAPSPTLNMWGSINVDSGDVVTATFIDGMGPDPGSVSTEFLLYDYEGSLLETIGPGASPLAFSAVPYTGRYIVRSSSVASGVGVLYASCDVTFTSSGTLSVNPIQALWDSGLSCPSRLNCV